MIKHFHLPSALAILPYACVALGFAILSVIGCTSVGGSAREAREDTVALGRQIFVANCVVCHGEKGDRVPAAPLNVKEFLDMRGDVTLEYVIREGKGVMPAWGDARGGPLSRDQVRAVVAYLNASAGRNSPTILASSGLAVYRQQCERCHGERGDRIAAVPLNRKSFLDARTDVQITSVISNGKGQMPAFRTGVQNPLSDEQVQALVSYLRYNANSAAAEEVREGRDLYMANCLSCHGERGDRVPNVALKSPDFLSRLGDGKITSVISNGTGAMPGFGPTKGGTLQAAQIGTLLAYLKSSAGLPADAAIIGPERSGRGRDIYMANCAGCHGESGDKIPGANLRSREYLDARTDEALRRQISQGNARGMPAWGQAAGGPLSTTDIQSVIDYLRGVAEPTASGAPQRQVTPVVTPAVSASSAVSRGRELFARHCVICHGESRDRIPTAKLADSSWLQQRGDDALSQAVANGKGTMPSWGKEKGGPLTQDDIAAILTYLKNAASGNAAGAAGPVDAGQPASINLNQEAARGKTLYEQNCLACHGDSRDKVAKAKLNDARWLAERGDEALAQSIANGKGAMPAWGRSKGGPLDDDGIAALLSFLKALAR